MLTDLLPLMTDTVRHWDAPIRNVFGKASDAQGFTEHRARVVYSSGVRFGEASRQETPDFAAVVWLIDHPRTVAIGDTFTLDSTGDVVRAVGVQRRARPGATITKVFVK